MSVGVGPAGSGKTYTVAAGARAWEANGGHVIGVTCSQAAANILAKAGIGETWNSTRFLGAVDRGMQIPRGTLFVIDEGSMMSMAHLARLTDLAEQTGGKIFLTGDHPQLAAAAARGGMTLAAHHPRVTPPSVPRRVAAGWESESPPRL